MVENFTKPGVTGEKFVLETTFSGTDVQPRMKLVGGTIFRRFYR